MRKCILAAAFFLILFNWQLAAYSEETLNPKEKSDKFLEMVEIGKIDEAYNFLFEGTNMLKEKGQEIDVVKKQTQMAMSLYGNIIGVEFISEENIGSSINRLVFLMKFEKYPIVWEFYFYKPKEI